MDKHTMVKINYAEITEVMQQKARLSLRGALSDDCSDDLRSERRGVAHGMFESWLLIFSGDYQQDDYDNWQVILG